MSNYFRVPAAEDGFETLHGINPQIYQERISHNNINSKIIFGGKEIIINEVLDKGLTKDALLTYNGETKRFNRVYDAEVEAVKILREIE